MRFIPLTQEKLIDVKVFFHKIKNDFLPRREGKGNPLEDYITRGRYRMFIAMQEDMVVGYIAYDTMYHKAGRIIGIAVLPELRRKGVATELLQRAFFDLRSRNIKSVVAGTWESNLPSQELLKKHGFKKYKTEKDDRINGESTLWFKRKL